VILGGNGLFTAVPGYDYVTGFGSWDIIVVNKEPSLSSPNALPKPRSRAWSLAILSKARRSIREGLTFLQYETYGEAI
jgi:hypothetical protein